MKTRAALTEHIATQAQPKEKPYKMADGGGMYLYVHSNGGKYWRIDYRFQGKQKTLAIGVYPEVTLSEARERREQARKLLAEAGYPKGFSFKNLGTSAQGVTEFQQFEIDYLSQVGIKMEMELVDTPTFNQRRNNGDFDSTSRLLPAVNPDMVLFSYLHPDNIAPKGLNGARYNNPKVTALLSQARAELDPKKRMETYGQLQKIVMTDLPYLPMYSNGAVWPSKQSVTGVRVNYMAQVNFFEVDLK